MKYLAFLGIALGILLVGCAGLCLITLSLVGGDDTSPLSSGQLSTPLPSTVATETLIPVSFSSPMTTNGNLRVHFIDVGQGDSILIQTPSGITALIDGGNQDGMALAYLQRQGISQIDVMIATHPHADHIGGLIEVMNAMPVGQIWTNGAIHTTDTFETLLDTIAARQIPYFEAERGGAGGKCRR